MKRIIFWDYPRGTWQYDVLCLLIIAFIFLSPGKWFDNREKKATIRPKLAVQRLDRTLPPKTPEKNR